MKKLIAVLLALALPVAADGPVVCSETPQSPRTACSAVVQSSTSCVCVAAEAGSAEPSVYDDAISLWKLDEASGTRVDSIGSNDLTDNNTVGSTSKGVGAPANLPDTVASFVAANSESLSKADPVGMDGGPGSSYTASIWVKYTDNGNNDFIYTLINTGGSTAAAALTLSRNSSGLGYDGTGKMNASVGDGTTTKFGGWPVPDDPVLSSGTWYHVVAVHDGAASELKMYINGALALTISSGAAYPLDMTNPVLIFGNIQSLYADVSLSSAAWWDYAKDIDGVAELYNSGDGAPLP